MPKHQACLKACLLYTSLEEMKVMKKRLISSFCFLIPLFYVSMGHMVGAPLPSILLGHENMMIFALTQLLLATPVLIINKKFFVVGFQALWPRAPTMDSLVALGSAASYIYSIFAIYAMAYYICLLYTSWRRGDVLQCKKAGGNRCGNPYGKHPCLLYTSTP